MNVKQSWTCGRCGVVMPVRDKLDHLQHCKSPSEAQYETLLELKKAAGQRAERDIAALRSALKRLADAAETVLGDDEDSPSYKDDLDECDAALDEARLVLGE